MFVSVYSTTAWDLEKNQLTLDLYQKKLVSHYSTTMVNVTWKKFNQTRSLPKTKVGYNTTMVHGTWKKLSRRWYPTEKNMFSIPATVLL